MATLQKENRIEESVAFPTGVVFGFILKIGLDNNQILNADFEDNRIAVTLAKDEAEQWITTNQVGLEADIALAESERLHILVEKDFPCVDRPEEDKLDTFWELAPDSPDAC